MGASEQVHSLSTLFSFAVDHGTTNSIYFRDPAGNKLELYCDVGLDGLARARRRTARTGDDFPALTLES